MATLKIKKLVEEATIPQQMTKGSIGLDLAALTSYHVMPTNVIRDPVIVSTGIALEIPKGHYATIHLRSSIGKNTKLRLSNQTGIIDSDYRGEIKLLIENVGKYTEYIAKGQRIAQLILHKAVPITIEEADTLSETERGEGGFGSTN